MVEVKLHDIGEGMTEADINCYLVKAGDFVKADDPLVEVQTDKMTAEIPAPRSGIVKQILLSPGETVKVGTTLLIMEDMPSNSAETSVEKLDLNDSHIEAEAQPVPGLNLLNRPMNGVLTEGESKKPKRILASPYTRKIARENNVNILDVTGSGPAGRIVDEDVYTFIKRRDSKAANDSEGASVLKVSKVSEHGSEAKVLNDSEGGSELARNEVPKHSEALHSDILPFRGRRKQIAKKMVQSLYTIPHCTHFEEIDVSELICFRQELKDAGNSISATAFFIKALSIGLKEFPVFNAKLDEENESIQLLREHHIGIAIDTPDGLIVPVIRNVEQKNLKQIHEEMKRLTKLALDDKLTVKDISGGTFTISNVGPLGGSIGATPIIQHPQTALVSFHKTKKRPVVTEQDEIAIRSIMNLSMAFDHRVADGATAVAFTNRFAQLIENPKMMLLELM
ncbi:dihydrolipoamide acetyltransferase family protein [Bacillus sp. JJ1609]|uniref:dihydrolipoamide acetyltransferase family protein n=1 Tax=Bacillus sp. JJ1609 TaxID=3122977 RepID=UPI002FFDF465